MRVIIRDTNALIVLGKAALLEALRQLPYEVQVPDLLYEDEPLSKGLRAVSQAGERVEQALRLERAHPALRLYDCATVALAQATPDCILLSGDSGLRTMATQHEIEVHDVLWAFDEIHRHGTAYLTILETAITMWENDVTVWLPTADSYSSSSG